MNLTASSAVVRLQGATRWLALDRGSDLPLLLAPLLWAAWLASAGQPDWAALSALLLAVLLVRAAAWFAYSAAVASPLLVPATHRAPVMVLLVAGLCFALPLGWPLLLLPLSLACAAAWWQLRRHSFLAQAALAAVPAWLVPAAWLAQNGSSGKIGGLLFVAALLWSAAAVLTRALARQVSEREAGWTSLALLFGDGTRWVVAALHGAMLLALVLLGRQAGLGVFFFIGVAVAGLLGGYQQWLLGQDRADAARALEAWWALALFCGIAFHFLCACQGE